jgi:Zn-dependent protease with chaperone function
MIGYLKGNGILINESQFPEAYTMIQEIKTIYQMKTEPKVFLIQEGGVLNAYAARFVGRNYIAIYADVFEQIEKAPDVLKFILAHEMAHVEAHHVQKMFWTGLSFYVPFLAQAYSRACEYTCDMNGYVVSKTGARNGLVMLAAGKHLYNKVNIEQYIRDYQENSTFVVKFVEKLSSHPNLPKRIEYLEKEIF